MSHIWWVWFGGFLGMSLNLIVLERNDKDLKKVPGWFQILCCIVWPVMLFIGVIKYVKGLLKI